MALVLDPSAPEPPYEQVRVQIATQAACGELPAGTKLPTVRALAAELSLAVNTVARAYRELEEDGVLVTQGRRGTFVASSPAAGSIDATTAAHSFATAVRRLGLTSAEAHQLLDDAW